MRDVKKIQVFLSYPKLCFPSYSLSKEKWYLKEKKKTLSRPTHLYFSYVVGLMTQVIL